MTHHPIARRWRGALAALAGLAFFAGCGGGVDSGGTGAPIAVALAAGPIDGFGSIIVNDIHFDPSAASITDQDGNSLTADQLQIGMTTRIDATALQSSSQATTSSALTVRVDSELIGPVASVGPLGSSLVVLSQTVIVTAATWFDPALSGGTSAVQPGQVLEVFGQYNARSNQYVATRILPRVNPAAYEIRGLLTASDSAAQQLLVGGLTIDISAVAANTLPTLTVGRFLRISLAPSPVGGVWKALTVAAGNLPWPDRQSVTVAGRISSLSSPTQFSLNGIAVDASGATYPAGTAGVVLGARVVVVGASVSNVLDAATVTVKGDETTANSTFEFHGAITALDTVAQTLTVRGITVSYSGQVQFAGGTLADLATGQSISVVGTLAANRTSVQAQSVTFE